MGVCVSEAVARADVLVSGVGYSPSTLWQYRWAWSQVEEFCSQQEVTELTDEVVASFLGFVMAEHRAGRCKEWKRKLLRRAVLVLSETATTGSYTWTVFREAAKVAWSSPSVPAGNIFVASGGFHDFDGLGSVRQRGGAGFRAAT